MNVVDLKQERKRKTSSVTSKKSPNVYKSCPKLISLKMKDAQKLPKNVGDLGKLTVAICFKKLPKVQ